MALTLFILGSCEKEEALWVLPPAGSETQADFGMGENYEYMVYFHLKTGTETKKKIRDWDIAFATGESERHLILNGGNEVQVFNTHDTTFKKIFPLPSPNDWQWDNPNGDKDSTAFGCWWNKQNGLSLGEVYLVDLGPKSIPRILKMRILSVDSCQYRIAVAEPHMNNPIYRTIKKNKASNYTYFDLREMEEHTIEPESEKWDLVFTKYRHIYYDMTPITPYYVCGVQINTKYCRVYESRDIPFEGMNKDKAIGVKLSKKADEIGYDWKYFDMASLRYSITKNQCFIIEDKDGFLYKLKFIDFYDTTGAKGHPSFVYQRL